MRKIDFEEIYDKAEELAEENLCKKGCVCPKLKEQGLCSGCEVFYALREYHKEILEDMEYYEVNTIINIDGEIGTSNEFDDLEEAWAFYQSIPDCEMKEILARNEDGNMVEEIASNYGH